MNLRAVSLFSNCGAGDVGYRRAGFRFDVMAELDARRLEVCSLNHPEATTVPGDLNETWPQVVSGYRVLRGGESPALLAACPPCQGMSTAKSGRGREDDADAGSKDDRNLLVSVIAKVTAELKPDLVVVENVPAFLTRKIRHPESGVPVSAARYLIAKLEAEYQAFPLLANLAEYGVPQTRKRAFLTFVRTDLPGLKDLIAGRRAPYPRPDHGPEYGDAPLVTLKQALLDAKFPSLDAKTEAAAVSETEEHHRVPVWPPERYAMVAAIPRNTGRSAWENNQCARCGTVDAGQDDAECPRCRGPLLRPVVRLESGGYRLIKGFRSSSYRRMRPDRPACTITTATGHVGSDFTIHPFENRVLSPLECAYLQTFPAEFRWGDAFKKWGHSRVRDMIGEAVPPLFTEKHGLALKGVLSGEWSVASIALADHRCASAAEKLGLTPVSGFADSASPGTPPIGRTS